MHRTNLELVGFLSSSLAWVASYTFPCFGAVKTVSNNLALKMKPALGDCVQGTVKWFAVKNGYGFANQVGTHEDIFLHRTEISSDCRKKEIESTGKQILSNLMLPPLSRQEGR